MRVELQNTRAELAFTKEELTKAKEENIFLKSVISELSHKKTSSNSSIPPSTEIEKKTKSLRQKSGKKTGGQKGHKGFTLEMRSNPDKQEDYISQYCQKCGQELKTSVLLHEKRQLIDIPSIQPHVTEYRVYKRICQCGYCNIADFPKDVRARISYGPNIKAMCAYFNVRQYMSFSRTKEMFADIFNIHMSEGTVANIMKSVAKKCEPVYEQIRQRISQSTCVGSDESGARVAGKTQWIWAWQTRLLTFLVISSNRGFNTIKENFQDGFLHAILVHDCWKPHFNTLTKGHQICIAHILRELAYFIEKRQKWAYEFLKLLLKALNLKKQMLCHPNVDYTTQIKELERQKNDLLNENIEIKNKKLKTLQKRLIRYNYYLFTFLHNPEVPPDNNATESAIRNIKIKLKVSGQFRTFAGAQYYAVIRSVIDTTIKNGKNVFNILSLVSN